MNLKSTRRIVFVGQGKGRRRLVQVTLVGFFAFARASQAQSVMAPPPSFSVAPPSIQQLPPGEMEVFKPYSALANYLDELNPLQWGPVTLHPHVSYSFTYGTGVQSGPGQQHDTIDQTLAPGVLFVYGKHWTLDYTPSFTFYSDKNFKDTLGQSVILTGATSYEDWTMGFSQSFSYSSSPQVQTGAQTDQQNYGTSLTASHALNSYMSVDLSISQDLNFPTGFQTTKHWSTLDWLNYQLWPRLTVGVGAGVGYTDANPNSLDEQVQGRISWRATDKISFQVNGGPQFMQFTDGGAKPLLNPVFGGSIQYLPFEHTQLTLGAQSATAASYYDNQVTRTTSVNAGLNQRLFERYNLSVGGGYTWTTYIAAIKDGSINAPEEYYSINVQLSTMILKRGSVGIFYTYSDNITTQAGLAYSSNQIGFNLGYSY